MIGAWEPTTYGDLPALASSVNRTEPRSILFIGDLHADSPYADRVGIRRVLDEAVERDAAIILLGDTFDAMQSKGDKRGNKAALMERYAGRDDYLNALLEDVAGFLRPYAANVWILLHGNHDSGITKYHEVDLVKLLARDMNAHGGRVITPGYQTYLAIKTGTSGCKWHHVTLGFITHGSGGASPITKGAIGMARRATTYPDAAFIVSGHLHTDVQVSHPQYRVSHKGRLYVARQRHVQVGAWKLESHTAPSWAVEKGMPPALPAAYWLEFRRARGDVAVQRVQHRFVEATA